MLLFMVLTHVLVHANGFQTTTICTPSVVVEGRQKRSEHGNSYFEYRGIPYARPPLGELRFKEPQEIQCTHEFRQLEDTPACIQKNFLFSHRPPIEGQEDCLYLNVFVPVYCQRADTKCPVLVFFHWGGFFAGRATTGYLGPEYLMDRNVVVVTANYRLGPFGFLSTSDDEAPGNYGLKDQVAVLKWVNQNIDQFWGNPDDVTISGQSSGAASVHYHLMSPLTENLFKKAISLSGVAMSLWAFPLNSLQKVIAQQQGKMVGCANETSEHLIECLRKVPANTIIETQDNFRLFYGNPVSIFGPVVEQKTIRNPAPFITKTPLDYLSNGEFRKVPWLVGFVRNEGVMKVKDLLDTDYIRNEINSNFEAILSGPLFALSLSAKNPHSLYENITNFYLEGKEQVDLNDKAFLQGFIDIFSDRAFVYPLYQTLQLHSCSGHNPIYLYQFDYFGAKSYSSVFSENAENGHFNWNNCHCDDLLYVFNSPDLFPNMTETNDKILREKLLDIWSNFIKQGDPSVYGTFGNRWRPIENICHQPNDHFPLFRISGDWKRGSTFEIRNCFSRKRMAFWRTADIFENDAFRRAFNRLINKTTV